MTGNTIRLIALDLDHTLWGGVLGEEGIAGIQLGGDYPGNAYKDFQRLLLKLQARGIALAILSKNDEDLVIEAMSEHPHMLIRPSMLAAHFINWQEKSINLMQLSDQIKIGLQHILLIDDNPLEREKIREMLPEVKVLELPEDPALYSDALLSSPYIECVMMTEEDKKIVTEALFEGLEIAKILNMDISLEADLRPLDFEKLLLNSSLRLLNVFMNVRFFFESISAIIFRMSSFSV